MVIAPEPSWKELAQGIYDERGIVFLLGATDSGKSTLARYLVETLVAGSRPVALIDSDVGQTSLGLPGTISAKLFSKKDDLRDFTFEKLYFIGSINPAEHIQLMIHGTKRISDLYHGKADTVIIDSTGLIAGEAGISLKTGKINLVKPDHIVALQRGDELEPIISLIKDTHVHRIIPSPKVRMRKREERIAYRKKKFEDYFRGSEKNEFSVAGVEYFHNGRSLSLRYHDFKKGVVLGLNHKEDTMGLGILKEIADDSVILISPVRSLKGINRIVFGTITL